MNDALAALEDRVRADLNKTAHPDAAWLTPKLGADDRPALDVLIVGAGQSGLATAFGLLRSQVSNILVLDKSEEGREGPWLTYARMHTLRSPKHFTGPDLDIPSLTYQSWHEARFGEEDWRKLDLISRELWAEYLLWFRRIVDVPVRNGCEVDRDFACAKRIARGQGADRRWLRYALCTKNRVGDGAGGHGRLDRSRAAAPSAAVALRPCGAADRLRGLARQARCGDRRRRFGLRQCRGRAGITARRR